MGIETTHVVLWRPRGAANLGAVARAMKNFGLRRLTLVGSRLGSWADAWRMAVQSGDVLEGAAQTDDLDAALAAATWVVGTTNRPLPGQALLTPRQVAEQAAERGGPTLLFGCEESGLPNHALLRCHAVSCIPVAPEQSSLNLAQAVLVYAAELFAAAAAHDPGLATAPLPPAAPAAPAGLLQHLEQALDGALRNSAWADKCRPKDALGELMQPFYRAGMTEAEARAWLLALTRIVRR
jgi:TrmH family RNA methyltransferase